MKIRAYKTRCSTHTCTTTMKVDSVNICRLQLRDAYISFALKSPSSPVIVVCDGRCHLICEYEHLNTFVRIDENKDLQKLEAVSQIPELVTFSP